MTSSFTPLNPVFYPAGDGKYIAKIPRTGSIATVQGVLEEFYPEQANQLNNVSYPNGVSDREKQLITESIRRSVSGETNDIDETSTVFMVTRDPVERFRSAMARLSFNKDQVQSVDDILTQLETEGVNLELFDFKQQHTHILNGNYTFKLYKFETDLEQLCFDVGLQYPLPTLNETVYEKPILTPEQQSRVESVYANDILLYNSINLAGQEVQYSQLAPSSEEIQQKLDEIATARYEQEVGGIDVGGNHVRTDRQTQSILTSAFAMLETNPDLTIQWKMKNGKFVTLTATEINLFANSVLTHVQACFNNEKTITDQVLNATTRDQLNSISWS